MTTRTRLDAEHALHDYTRRHKRQLATAALGNNAGTVDVSGRDDWVWCRLHGDANQVIQAYCGVSIPRLNNLVVAVEKVERHAAAYYSVVSIATNITYASNDAAGLPGAHASQHQRRDFGSGGFDPLDIYNRALVNLRARAQVPAAMTVYVEVGWYFLAGTMGYWAGGSSPTFTAPAAAGTRADLLYIGTDYGLHISTGTDYHYDGSLPDISTPVGAYIPIAVVYLTSATTSITESIIRDARVFLTASASVSTGHDLLSSTHTDAWTRTVVEDDLILATYSPAWASPAWDRLAKGGDGDVLTVNSTTHHVAWCSPQSVPGGGDAPATAEYVTTAADATLSAEVVIPALAGAPDRTPGTVQAQDDDFDGALNAKWTETSTAGAHDHDTTWPSCIYAQFAADGLYNISQAYAPAGDFSLTAKFHGYVAANYEGCHIYVYDNDESDAIRATYQWSTQSQFTIDSKDATVWTYGRQSLAWTAPRTFYLHLQRVTNTWYVYWSDDGYLFHESKRLSYTKAFTPHHFEVELTQGGSTAYRRTGIDWVRRDWLTL